MNLDDLNDNKYIMMIRDLTEKYPGAAVVPDLSVTGHILGMQDAAD